MLLEQRPSMRYPLNQPLQPSQQPPNMENSSSDGHDPSGFLSEIIGAPVTVKLNSGIVYKGTFRAPPPHRQANVRG